MRGDLSVLLCVVCFISGLVLRCIVSATHYCESETINNISNY